MLELDLNDLDPSSLSNADLKATFSVLRRAMADRARAWQKFRFVGGQRSVDDRRLQRVVRAYSEASASIAAIGGPSAVRKAMRRLVAEMLRRKQSM